MRVLLADTVAESLPKLSMAVDVCYDGKAALERLLARHGRLILSARPRRIAYISPRVQAIQVGVEVEVVTDRTDTAIRGWIWSCRGSSSPRRTA